jgi:GntR family transcriptional regulator / MocR family aminotransferase
MMPIPLDRAADVSLQEQIYRYVRDRVIDGTLATGTKVPSTRDLAGSLRVSRNTTVLAYDWLAAEGYIETRSGAGTFVARVVLDHMAAPLSMPSPMPIPADPAPDEAAAPVVAPSLRTAETSRPIFDFWYGRPDPRLFPANVWRSLAVEVLGACAKGLTDYGPIGGDPRLQKAIADHLAGARGITAAPEQVIVTTGAQEALNLVARLFVTDDSAVVVEEPGYAAAAQVFESHGACVYPGALDRDGLDPTGLRGIRPRLVYVTPSHQFPTGAVMSLGRRRALVEHCGQYGGLIVEDDYDGEIVFDRPPIAALSALDRLERTIYIGSFSKTLGSGLRLGYVVVPQRFVADAQATKSLMSYGQSWLDQQILAEFLASGRYQRHLRRLRVAYRGRRDATLAGLRTHLDPNTRISGGEGGLHLFCTLPRNGPDAATLASAARGVGVGLYPAAICGVRSSDVDLPRSLVVGFATLTPEEIDEAFARVGRVARDLQGAFRPG